MIIKPVISLCLFAIWLGGCNISDNSATISSVDIEEEFAPFFPIELGETVEHMHKQLGPPGSFGFGDCACADGRYDKGPYAGLAVFFLEYALFSSPEGNHLRNGWTLGMLAAEAPYALETESGIGLGTSRGQVERLLGKPDLRGFRVAGWEAVGLSHYIQEGYLANDSVAYAVRYDDNGRLRQIEKVLLYFQARRYTSD